MYPLYSEGKEIILPGTWKRGGEFLSIRAQKTPSDVSRAGVFKKDEAASGKN